MTLVVLSLASHGCRYYYSFSAGKYVQHTNRVEEAYIERGFFQSMGKRTEGLGGNYKEIEIGWVCR